MIHDTSSELEPWIVIQATNQGSAPALWQLQSSAEIAVALFSDSQHAQDYAAEHITDVVDVVQPSRLDLLKMLIECYRQGVQVAVLDPNATTTSRLFVLRDVLRAARNELCDL